MAFAFVCVKRNFCCTCFWNICCKVEEQSAPHARENCLLFIVYRCWQHPANLAYNFNKKLISEWRKTRRKIIAGNQISFSLLSFHLLFCFVLLFLLIIIINFSSLVHIAIDALICPSWWHVVVFCFNKTSFYVLMQTAKYNAAQLLPHNNWMICVDCKSLFYKISYVHLQSTYTLGTIDCFALIKSKRCCFVCLLLNGRS